MRTTLTILTLVLAMGANQGCSCNNAGTGDGGDTDGGTGEDLAVIMDSPDLLGVDLYQADGIVVTLGDGGTFVCFIGYCQGKVYQCGNCMDDDGDGLVDSLDPDCLGPCQNNETSFYGNIPGQNNAPCKSDCYWDQDTGPGNDNCYWDHGCDPFQDQNPKMSMPEVGCRYNPNTKVSGAQVPAGQMDCTYLLANQPTACTDYCKPLTPNGCDCFGCCTNPKPGATGAVNVWAGSTNADKTAGTCDGTAASLADQTKCKPCTPVPGCSKPCGRCQLCFGKTAADLPADCFQTDGGAPDGGIAPPPLEQCPGGETPCGLPGQAPCLAGQYCITGCCQDLVF